MRASLLALVLVLPVASQAQVTGSELLLDCSAVYTPVARMDRAGRDRLTRCIDFVGPTFDGLRLGVDLGTSAAKAPPIQFCPDELPNVELAQRVAKKLTDRADLRGQLGSMGVLEVFLDTQCRPARISNKR